jgi:hypothetical protein
MVRESGQHRAAQIALGLGMAAVGPAEDRHGPIGLAGPDRREHGGGVVDRDGALAMVASLQDRAQPLAGLEAHALSLLVRIGDPAQVAHGQAGGARALARRRGAIGTGYGHRQDFPPVMRVRARPASRGTQRKPRCGARLQQHASDRRLLPGDGKPSEADEPHRHGRVAGAVWDETCGCARSGGRYLCGRRVTKP